MSTYLLVLIVWSSLALGASLAVALNEDGVRGVLNVRFPLLLGCFLLAPAWIPLVLLGQLLHWCLNRPHGYWGQDGRWRKGEKFRFWGLAWRTTAVGLMRETVRKEEQK